MSEVELRITADLDEATRNVSGFRKQYQELVKSIEKPLRQIDGLQKTQESAKSAAAEFFAARGKVDSLRDALAKVRGPSDALGKSLNAAQKQIDSASSAIERQKRKLDEQRLAVQQARTAYDALRASMAQGGATKAEVAGAKSGLNGALAELERQRIALREQRSQLADSRRSVKELGEAYRQASEPVRLIERDLRNAEHALGSTSRAFEFQKSRVREQRAELKSAGVDYRNLAAEQKRLQAELSQGMQAGARGQALQAATKDLGVERYRLVSAELTRLRGQYDLLRSSGTLTGRELVIAQQTLATRIRETRRELAGMAGDQSRIGRSGGLMNVAAVAGAGYSAVNALRAYTDITDSAKKMDAQLRLVTSSQEEFNRAQADTFGIAQANQAPVEEIVSTYARLVPALDEIGRKGDAAKVVDALTKALRINGSTTAESASTLLQFSQAMASGVLRGEEFNSIAEAAPPLLRALASGLNVPTGALRGMAAEGLLTAEVITDLVVKALPDLTEAASKLPDTVDGALTRLRNDLLKSFGQGDTSGLIEAITQLRTLLTDPQTVQGLTDLAAGMATLAGWAVTLAAEFSAFAKELAYSAAQASGNLDELTKLEETLKRVKQARDGGSLIGRPTATFFMDNTQLDAWIKELEGKIDAMNARIAGMTLEAYRKARESTTAQTESQQAAAQEQEQIENERYAGYSRYVSEMKSKQDEAVAHAEKALKAMTSAEKKASKKKAQLDTQKRYSDALKALQGSGSGPGTFIDAMAYKNAANQALRAGDLQGAKDNAQAALKVLQDLAEAGANTYGFAGFIKSLKAIEDQADQINVDKAQSGLDQAKQKAVDLKELLESIKTTTISVKMDDEALAKARDQINALVALAGGNTVLPVEVRNPAASNTSATRTPAQQVPSSAGQTQQSPGAPRTSSGTNTGLPTVPVDIAPQGIRQDGPNIWTNLPPVPVDVLPKGIRQDGENSFTNMPAVPVDVLPKGIRQDGENSFTNLPAVPVDVLPKGIRQDGDNSFTNLPPVDVELQVDQEASNQVQQQLAALAQSLKRELVIPVTPVTSAGGTPSEATPPGFASGGLINGPGTGTSDSILARLSNGEFVMRAAAVKHYGSRLLQQINTRQLPKFADGGLVSSALAPAVPMMASSLATTVEAAQGPDLSDWGRVALDLGSHGSYEVLAKRPAVDSLRRLRMKFGGTNS